MYFLNRGEVFIFAIIIGFSHASYPYIDSSGNSYSVVSEDFTGTIFRFHVTDRDEGDILTIRPLDNITAEYFNVDQVRSGNDVWVNVTVRKPLDRETLGSIVKAMLSISDTQQNEIQFRHTVYISDVNDNRPEFENSVYTLEIDELPCNKTTVYTKIHATDKDSNLNGRIRYSMVPNAQSPELWKMYNDTFSIDPVFGYVTLNKCLDYKRNDYYNFIITAKSFSQNHRRLGSGPPGPPPLPTDSGPHRGLQIYSIADLIIHVRDVKDESSAIIG